MRQIVLDTETTGLDIAQGHRIIEIGCVEIENRRLTGRQFHTYLNPSKESDEAALEVHGITTEFLADKPDFAQIAAEFIAFISDSELIIHNAPFDLGFLNNELNLLEGEYNYIEYYAQITDTLLMARHKHPGQRNNLDALCKRYHVDNSQRDLHGALKDAEILADVYLAMTGGQTDLSLSIDDRTSIVSSTSTDRLTRSGLQLKVILADETELLAHEQRLQAIAKVSKNRCLWLNIGE